MISSTKRHAVTNSAFQSQTDTSCEARYATIVKFSELPPIYGIIRDREAGLS